MSTVLARVARSRTGPPPPVIVGARPPAPRIVGARTPGTVLARVAGAARTIQRPGIWRVDRARIGIRWKLPGRVVPLGLGQACDPRTASCPPESQPAAVRSDLPGEWLTTFQRPTGSEINEASEDASTWETFVQGYTARAGMAFARLRATLTNYMILAARQQRELAQKLRDHPNASADTRMKGFSAIQSYTLTIAQLAEPLAWLNAVAAGQAMIGFNLVDWKFAYVPRNEWPADLPNPIVISPQGIGFDIGLGTVIVIAIVGMFVAGGAIAYWSAEREKAEPAVQRAKGEAALAQSQARSLDFMTQLAAEQSAQGHPDAAAAIIAMAQGMFRQDLHALNEGNWANTAAAQAEAEKGWGGIGEMVKWGLLALFALKAMEHL